MTRPAVFLDRDGTLVEDVPYLHDPERLVLLPGAGVQLDAVHAVLAGAMPAGGEEARPTPAVTERAWPGMPVGRERARP